MIDHWYQLHVKTFRGTQAVEGPIEPEAMLARIGQIIACEDGPLGEVAHSAFGVRLDVNQVNRWERQGKKWKLAATSTGLPTLPKLMCERIEKFVDGHTYMMGKAHCDLAVQVSPDEMAVKVWDPWSNHVGLRPRATPGKRTTTLWLTAKLVHEVGVDLNRFTERVSPKSLLMSDDPLEEEDLSTFGDVVSLSVPVVGFRMWHLNTPSVVVEGRVVEAEPQLFGPNVAGRIAPFEWGDAQKTAECIFHLHRAPVPSCSCGLYARYYQSPYIAGLPQSIAYYSRGCMVVGAVLGAGDVLLHDGGWRAETARIIGFRDDVEPRFLPALRELAGKFDVPILAAEGLEKLALSKGARVQKSDLPSPGM